MRRIFATSLSLNRRNPWTNTPTLGAASRHFRQVCNVLALLLLLSIPLSAAQVEERALPELRARALQAMLRGENPAAYLAELSAIRPESSASKPNRRSSASKNTSALQQLSQALIGRNEPVAARALLAPALGEVLLQRAAFEDVGSQLKSRNNGVALSRWQRLRDQNQESWIQLEQALRAAVLAQKQGSDPVFPSIRRTLSTLRAATPPRILGNRQLPIAPADFPPRALPADFSVTPSFADSAAAAGGAEDLVSTEDTELTLTISEKAAELEYEPVRIHDFVRTRIRTEWYAGAQKGASETLRSGAGNDVDQASLLIALLRASGMPSRYVKGVIELGTDRLGLMLGLADANDLGRALNAAGIANEPVITGSSIRAFRLEHMFVSTYVPYGNYRGTHVDAGGKAWIPLAPAIKDYEFTASTDVLDRASINAQSVIAEWLGQSSSALPLELIEQRAQAWLNTQPGSQTVDAQLQRRILSARPLGLLPSTLPTTLVGVIAESTQLTDADQQWLRLRVLAGSDDSSAQSLLVRMPVRALLGKRLTLSWQAATEDDHNIINAFGSVALTPAYLIRQRARIMLDGEVLAHGFLDAAPGDVNQLELISDTPSGTLRVAQAVTVGAYVAITLGAQASATPVSQLEAPVPNDSEYASAQRLASIGLRYAGQWNEAERRIEDLVGVTVLRPAPSIVLALVDYSIETELGLPRRLRMAGVALDAAQRPLQALAPLTHRAREAEFLRFNALHGSALEHRVFENDWGAPSVSADKVMQIAQQQNIALHVQTGGALPGHIALPDNVRAEINEQLARGWRLQLPEQPISLNLWQGAAWHAEEPSTGASGWFIAGGYAGGSTTTSPPDWPVPFPDPNGPGANSNSSDVAYLEKIAATDEQFVRVGEEAEQKLKVRALDARYAPVLGARIRFTVSVGEAEVKSDGAWGQSADVLTDLDGLAEVSFKSADVIFLGRETYLQEGDRYPTFVGSNEVTASAHLTEEQGGGAITNTRIPFRVWSTPGDVAELRSARLPAQADRGVEPPSVYMGQWLLLTLDQYGNVVSNAPINFSSSVELPQPNHNCSRSADSRPTSFYDPVLCPFQTFPVQGQCGSESLQILSSTPYVESGVGVISGDDFGATYTAVATTPGASPKEHSWRTQCGASTFQWLWTPAYTDFRGRLIEAQLPQKPLGYRRTLQFFRYEPTDGSFNPPNRLVFGDMIPPVKLENQTGDRGIIAPLVADGRPGKYTTTYTSANSAAHRSLNFVEVDPPERRRIGVWGFSTVDFTILSASVRPVELDESGFLKQPWDLPWTWSRPTLPVGDEYAYITYSLDRTVRIRRDGAPWAFFRAGFDEVAPTVGAGAIEVPARVLRFTEIDQHEYTAEVVLHIGSPAELKSDPVVLKFGRAILESYSLNSGTNGSGQQGKLFGKASQAPIGRYPSKLRMKQTLDRPAGLVCFAPTEFSFELYRSARVEVLAFPIGQDGSEGSPLAIIEEADYEEGSHRKSIQPFDIPWGDYRLQVTARDTETEEEEVYNASLANEVDMLDNLPLGHSIVQNVDLHDGNLGIARADVDLGGRGPGLKFTRFYSSPRPSRGDFNVLGYGWHSNLESGIELAGGCGGFLVTGADGGAQRFLHGEPGGNGDVIFQPLHGYHGTLIQRGGGSFDYFSIDGTRYHFERSLGTRLARLSRVEDTDGNAVDYIYGNGADNTLDQVVEMRDSTGRSLRFEYTSSNEQVILPGAGGNAQILPGLRRTVLSRVTAPGGLSVAYTYNSDGMMISALREGSVCAPGQCERYSYADLGRSAYLAPNAQFPTSVVHGFALTGIEQVGFASSAFAYLPLTLDQQILDGVNAYVVNIPTRGVREVNAFDSNVWGFNYLPPGRGLLPAQTTVLDGRSFATVHSLNAYGAAERVVDPAGQTSTVWNFTHYKPERITDALNRVTQYTYDQHGNTIREQVSGDVERTWTYQPPASFSVPIKNRASTHRDARGIQETYGYDSRGHLISRSRGGVDEGFGYDGNGDRIRHTDFNGGIWGFGFDTYGYPRTQTNPLGQASRFSYDTRGRMVSEEDASSHRVTYTHDNADRPLTRTLHGEGGGTQSTTYEQGGRQQTSRDELAKATVRRFDGLGRMLSEQNAMGVARTLMYDGNGNLTQNQDFRGNITTLVYDEANRLTTRTEPLGKVTAFTHDALGHVKSETISGPNSQPRTTEYSYDHPLYFRTRVSQLGGQGGDRTTTIEPDNAGNAVTTTDPLKTTTRTFDAFDRVTTIAEPGRDTVMTYDANGNPLSETVSGRSRSWTYDAANRVLTATDGAGGVNQTTYFPNGAVSTRIDPNGALTTYTVDAANRVTTMRGPRADQVAQFDYDAVGNVFSEIRPNGRNILHTYDDLHRLIESSDDLGTYLGRDYDADGNVTEESDARGNRTFFTVNALNQREDAQMPEGRVLSWTYSVHDEVLTETNAKGHVNTHSYDGLGQRLTTQLPAGSGATGARSWTYDAVGNVLTQTDSNGVVTTFGYDALSRKTSAAVSANDDGGAESWTHDARNNPLTHRDRGGITETMTYDGEDRLLSVSRADSLRLTQTYDPAGNNITQRDANGVLSTHTYDKANQRLSSKRGNDTESWTYTPSNQIKTHTDRSGDTATFTYDVRDRLTEEKNAENETRVYTLDGNGNRASIQTAKGPTWTQTFDAANRLQSVESPEGHATTYGWHADDQLQRITDGNSHQVTLESDALARIDARVYPGGVRFATVFDGEGNAKTESNPDTSISRSFDGLNRARSINYTGTSSAQLTQTFDARGNPTISTLTQAGRSFGITRQFDALSRLEAQRSNVGAATTGAAAAANIGAYTHAQRYTLDGNGNRKQVVDADNTTSTQSFDAYNRITQTVTPNEGSTQNVWNPDGTLNRVEQGGGNQTNYTYDRAKRIKSITHSKSGATTLSFVYHYDANGNRTQAIQTQSAINGQAGSIITTDYGYDNDDRLISTNVQHSPPSLTTPDERSAWTLDPVGNRLTETVTRLTDNTVTSNKTYTYSARDQLERMTDPVNQLTVQYGYDQNGNRISRTATNQGQPAQTITYTFDARDRLIGAQPNAPNPNNTPSVTYTYDPEAQRIESIETPSLVGATSVAKLYLYQNATLLHEATPSNGSTGLTLTNTYRHSALLDRHIQHTQTGNTIRRYQLDALQTPVAMIDASGDTVTRTQYNAWGEIEEQVADGQVQAPWQLSNYAPDQTGQAVLLIGDHQSIGFTGYQKDSTTGLYYANARWYDPLVGGFNGMDPAQGDPGTPLSLNKYLYAHANPTFFTDPDGREVWGAQTMRLNELAYTNSPVRAAQLREEIRVEGIRENARLGATLGYFRDTAVGIAEIAADAGKFAAEHTGIGMVVGLDLGGGQAVQERSRKLGHAILHPIDTFITPIQKMNALSAQLEAAGDIFGAAYVGHQAQLATTDVALMAAGGVAAARKIAMMRTGVRNAGPEIGVRDIDLDLDGSSIGSRELTQGTSTAPVVANVPEQAALGTMTIEGAASSEAATIHGPSSRPKATSVRKRDYPTRVRRTTQQRLEEAATDESGQIRCQNPGCSIEDGRVLQLGEGSPQHNPQLVETHNEMGWNVDQPTRNNLYNQTATEIHCIECQRIEGGQTRSTYRFDLGPNYEARPKRNRGGGGG